MGQVVGTEGGGVGWLGLRVGESGWLQLRVSIRLPLNLLLVTYSYNVTVQLLSITQLRAPGAVVSSVGLSVEQLEGGLVGRSVGW